MLDDIKTPDGDWDIDNLTKAFTIFPGMFGMPLAAVGGQEDILWLVQGGHVLLTIACVSWVTRGVLMPEKLSAWTVVAGVLAVAFGVLIVWPEPTLGVWSIIGDVMDS